MTINSHSLVNKIRFVALSLLDDDLAVLQPTEEARDKSQSLLNFMNVLSTIERVSY